MRQAAKGAGHAGGADPGRRNFLLAVGRLAMAAPTAAWTFTACSSDEPQTPKAEPRTPEAQKSEPRTPEAPKAEAQTPKAQPGASERRPPSPPAEPAAEQAPRREAGGGGEAPPAEPLVTEVAAAATLVQALQYVNESRKADQRCANCQLFTARSEERGSCQLFAQGQVAAGGWCASWAQRVTS